MWPRQRDGLPRGHWVAIRTGRTELSVRSRGETDDKVGETHTQHNANQRQCGRLEVLREEHARSRTASREAVQDACLHATGRMAVGVYTCAQAGLLASFKLA